tara:strand:- start:415 stop:576 length:162 start_codon:yes stop_codon:yes gene_type:complete
MAAKRKEPIEEVTEKADDTAGTISLVLKISEIEKLSNDDKQAFRDAGGTSIEG